MERNSEKMQLVLKRLARNNSTQVANSTIESFVIGTINATNLKFRGKYSLLNFKECIDTEKCSEPVFLAILTGKNYSYRRPDGIYVVSIGTLKTKISRSDICVL